jgi:GGDEF domain-containing protein
VRRCICIIKTDTGAGSNSHSPADHARRDCRRAEVFSNADTTELYDLNNQELERLALFDQLTQLPNRRYIDTFLDHQIRDYQTLGIPFGVLMLDLDFFKHVNDAYGHSTGDEMLKMVAGTFQNAMRRNDFIGRWGGEEFVAILRGVTHLELRTSPRRFAGSWSSPDWCADRNASA